MYGAWKSIIKKICQYPQRGGAYISLVNQKKRVREKATKIRVLFICQMPQLWENMKDVYEQMDKDEMITPNILAIPDPSESNKNYCYDFFKAKYQHVIDARDGNGWKKIPNYFYQYIFYQRPYDSYLPTLYQSNRLRRKGKLCYIPYGFLLTKTNENTCMEISFFMNISFFFADSEYTKLFNIERFAVSHKKGVRHSLFLGYPALSCMIEALKNTQNVCQENDKFCVIWTPRWTTNTTVGKSNFFKYKSQIETYFLRNTQLLFILRPHPLMFSNFEKTGEMRKTEIDEMIEKYDTSRNMIIDKGADRLKTFCCSNVLITDISSIIVEYLLTGNPIIYCDSSIDENQFMQEILSVCYCTESWAEIENTLEKLQNGEDPLKISRRKLAKKIMQENDINTAQRIVETIKQDYMSNVL